MERKFAGGVRSIGFRTEANKGEDRLSFPQPFIWFLLIGMRDGGTTTCFPFGHARCVPLRTVIEPPLELVNSPPSLFVAGVVALLRSQPRVQYHATRGPD